MSTVKAIRKLAKPDLLSIADLTPGEVESLFELTSLVKARPAEFARALTGKQLVLIFEKPSLRTRVTFEVGMGALGGRSLFIDQTGSRLGARESLPDVARNLERWVDGIVLRTFAHQTVTEMAAHAGVPVINALSDREHPCQALADYFTLLEKFHDLKALKLAFVGDGNNVAHSLLLTAARLGSRIAVVTPPGFEPAADVVQSAVETAAQTGASLQLTYDPEEAVAGADAVYTDVWASMGQEQQAGERANVFASFQVDDELMSHAAPHAVFMHCLPAHRGDEVTDAVMDSARSVVFDQAENRLHIQKAILLLLLGNGGNGGRRSRSAHA